MWSDYRIKENIINDFAVICKIIGEQGLLERRGDRENVVYRRYNKFRWTLTNKNGREADEYELTV